VLLKKWGLVPHPSFRMNDQYFIITLFLKAGVYKPATDLMDNLKKLNSKEKKGYDILADRKQITSSEYQIVVKVSERTARNHLNKMVELGLIFPEHAGKYIIYKLKV
jgi:predicted HTH transcriptional regulator